VIGLIQPDSGQFCLVHWQAVMLATFLALRRRTRRRHGATSTTTATGSASAPRAASS
jgi:hypothetical protein